MSFHDLLQGIFLTQGLNLGLLHCRQFLYHVSHQGSQWVSPCLCSGTMVTTGDLDGRDESSQPALGLWVPTGYRVMIDHVTDESQAGARL